MTKKKSDVLQGTLDLLILKAISLEPLHGWGISERLRQITLQALQVQQGSIYPALQRLERVGYISGRWAITENGRRAKYYTLTRQGRKQLAAETLAWHAFTTAVQSLLDMNQEEIGIVSA